MELQIVKFPNDILKKVCEDVELGSDEVRVLADNMLKLMYEKNGVGLAAPQVDRGVNVLVYDVGKEQSVGTNISKLVPNPKIMFNPKITGYTKDSVKAEEGCLSMLGVRVAKVPRHSKVQVEFYDKDWNKQEEWFEGFEARCVQHEVDHLLGKMHIDKIGHRRNMVLKEFFKRKC